MIYYAGLVLAIAFVAIAAGGCGVGAGLTISGALSAMARQPELYNRFQMVMFIGLAFVETFTIYSLVVTFILMGKLPTPDVMLELVKQSIK
ncbi:MAG: ATP synthase F0 subunit C [Planctomycetes bacterium RIFCSPHIGHO2_12_FULL_52_36]|nr:MAG: ATP synthase F0 subunit C [Planctomycetes bacterium RIFCSPHIGHO2_02_FULL_52_58]OHB93913.1 MAG: ATP synthase F0 subunit C [Planctomycetes bacterium RIFCSPHIGHO2_12_FULL_52_36]OHC05261.1 MAG: ATP synthase F0 subunit C [Planctomycetes bacterium RIFCSPHIGHO2_12_39_6]